MTNKFYVYEGNNGELIKNRLEVRGWEQTKYKNDILEGNVKFVWRPLNFPKEDQETYFKSGLGNKYFFNHFDDDPPYCDKDGLLEMLSVYYQKQEAIGKQ